MLSRVSQRLQHFFERNVLAALDLGHGSEKLVFLRFGEHEALVSAASDDGYDRSLWQGDDQVRNLTGIDPDVQPLGPRAR